MKHYFLNGSYLQPKLVASFADLGQSHPKTLRLTCLSQLGRPCRLGQLGRPPEQGHPLELPNVVFTNFAKYDIDQTKYLFQKWSHFNSSNSLSNCYLSSKYGIDDFYQFGIDNWETSTDPFIQNLLFLTHQADQYLIGTRGVSCSFQGPARPKLGLPKKLARTDEILSYF